MWMGQSSLLMLFWWTLFEGVSVSAVCITFWAAIKGEERDEYSYDEQQRVTHVIAISPPSSLIISMILMRVQSWKASPSSSTCWTVVTLHHSIDVPYLPSSCTPASGVVFPGGVGGNFNCSNNSQQECNYANPPSRLMILWEHRAI